MKFRAIFENSKDAIGISKQGINFMFNAAYLKLFGYSNQTELVNKPILEQIALSERSRIIDYKPPERFTDIQLKGPYKSWVHLHVLDNVPGGTLLTDEVTYKLHLSTLFLHPFFIRKKLMDIFSYRAVKISAWEDSMK